jgi:hypothetical protein
MEDGNGDRDELQQRRPRGGEGGRESKRRVAMETKRRKALRGERSRSKGAARPVKDSERQAMIFSKP